MFRTSGLLLALFCAIVSSSPHKRNAESSETSKDDGEDEDIFNVAKYFEQYQQLPGIEYTAVRIGYSSSAGTEHEDEVPIQETPAFVERVIDLQESAGIDTTGKVSPDVVREIKKARCGVNESPSSDAEAADFTVKATWDSKYLPQSQIYPLTFSIIKEEEIPESLTIENVEEAVLSAMCLWEASSNIRFRNIGNENMLADITVSFAEGDHGDWYSFDGRGGTLAHAFYPENGRLHFDKSEKWYLARKGLVDHYKKDLFTVAAHELGHNIGLMHSKKRKALMAPIYKYAGTVEEYKLGDDDIEGIESMYGERIVSNPANEEGTACNELRAKYGIAADKMVSEETNKKTVKTTKVVRVQCNDDRRFEKYCESWKRAGYCENPIHEKTLRRRCKSTCDFCPTQPMAEKPKRGKRPEKLSSSICGIERFDSVAVVLDARNFLNMLYFKDDYYFESSVKLETIEETVSHSMLNSSEVIEDLINWRTDPKTIKVNSYKINRPEMFAKSHKIRTVILTKNWYLAFEKEGGIIHQYSRGTPTISYVGKFDVKSVFEGYPHKKVDAGFVEYNVTSNYDSVYTLFHKNKIWQFKRVKTHNPTERLDQVKLVFEPIESMQGVPIEMWHGVPACDIDSVFDYRGVPYFLKDNTFWPAIDTEPMIPRDITYNFMRCWQEEPTVNPVMPSCDASFDAQNDDGNGNGVSKAQQSFLAIVISLFLSVFSTNQRSIL